MTTAMHSEKQKILNAVCEQILKKLPNKEALLCSEFTKQFFGTMSTDDIKLWTEDDLYGAALNFWSMIEKNNTAESKIKIYNPDFERYGWRSTHTVVEVLTKDMPFLVESIRNTINRMGFVLHLAVNMGGIRVHRDEQGELTAIISKESEGEAYQIEAPMFFLIDRQTDTHVLNKLEAQLQNVLQDVHLVVKDWMPMRENVISTLEELDKAKAFCHIEDVQESQEFLKWIENHHFTLLGIVDYQLEKNQGDLILQPIKGTGLGVLSDGRSEVSSINLSELPKEAQKYFLSKKIITISKSEVKSLVHRNAFIDTISVKRFDAKGEVIGERMIVGLFTSAAYYSHIRDIPLLRQKVKRILEASKLDPRSHAGRILLNILETLPRDDLIQGTESDLLEISQGIFHLQDRKRIKLFTRHDAFNRFLSCLVYVPKERYNTELRMAMEEILKSTFNASAIIFSTMFSESVLARIHFVIQLKKGSPRPSQTVLNEVESQLIEVGRTWGDDLQSFLIENYGEEQGNGLNNRYRNAFPAGYTSHFSPRVAVVDIKYLELINPHHSLQMNFYRELDDADGYFRLKLYQKDTTIPLSDVLPIIENMGLRAISERPFSIKLENGELYWINEFTMSYPVTPSLDIEDIREHFQQAFLKVWVGQAENDGFNKLVMAAGLNWREVMMFRAYAKYFKQMGINYSHDYIEAALLHNIHLAKKLSQYFDVRFNPEFQGERLVIQNHLLEEMQQDLENVSNLDEDKIIRQYIAIIKYTLRTNFYQLGSEAEFKSYVSFKFFSKDIPGMPKPYPKYEIFVYSPRFEGIHLRCSEVARGGLRWSDRKEDFRTEVLGLMKAQQVKNAVIVPNGAKGGFVPKNLEHCKNRDEVWAEGVACYQSFIRSLLDITDNYVKGELVRPHQVIPYDDVDPYLVVAADKGTATFSDYANEISKEYNFWLGDAFASGGSNGYDHKKMGITARGAWESVKRHFYYLGKDIQTTPFTVVGIGDMAGDVFGNGMLLSEHIQLLAAFNHMHIFLDPNPDTAISYAERQRMFNLPRSSWEDYDASKISAGGGVFNRSAKYIPISPEVAQRFNIQEDRLEPNELIKRLLCSQTELLWSAGIGTFVKSSKESNIEVGDRTNDAIRVNANHLRCKVVGEGGNLGCTQKGRIEYALRGGRIYTDFIDNSGGVSCSDKEVNIKILLDGLVKNGDLTLKHRDVLLSEMTDEVAALVLKENDQQTKAISLLASQAPLQVDLHIRYMDHLEKAGKLDRKIEFLPSTSVLLERKQNDKGLSIPEIAVLNCYSKILLKEEILSSNVPEESYFKEVLISYFPKQLAKKYADAMQSHPLKREIIATKISNLIVNEMGFTFIYRLQDETGAPASAIVSAYLIARSVLKMDETLSNLELLQHNISAQSMVEVQMLHIRVLRRLTRWLLRTQRRRLQIQQTIDKYYESVQTFRMILPSILSERYRAYYDKRIAEWMDKGLSEVMSQSLATLNGMFAIFDIVEISFRKSISIETAAAAFFAVGDYLQLDYIRLQIIAYSASNQWESLSREALRDDLDDQQRQLTESVINEGDDFATFTNHLKEWSTTHRGLIERWNHLLDSFRSCNTLTYTMFFVATRDLLDLTETAVQRCQDGDFCEFF
jgi:glutamate dehydrogenase